MRAEPVRPGIFLEPRRVGPPRTSAGPRGLRPPFFAASVRRLGPASALESGPLEPDQAASLPEPPDRTSSCCCRRAVARRPARLSHFRHRIAQPEPPEEASRRQYSRSPPGPARRRLYFL